MSYEFYNWIHVVSVLLVFSSLGAQSFYAAAGGEKASWPFRRTCAIFHGVGLTLLFIAGFGLMARIQVSFAGNPWLFIKLGIWLLLGFMPFLIWRFGRGNLKFFYLLLVLGSFAVYSVIYRVGAAGY